MKIIDKILYPFREEKFLLKIIQPLIIFIVLDYIWKILKINTNLVDFYDLFSEILILGYISIFAHNIINKNLPAVPEFFKKFFFILKQGIVAILTFNIYSIIIGLLLLPIILILLNTDNKLALYLFSFLISILVIPFMFCMYSYKLSFKESLKIKNIKKAINAFWSIKFTYLRFIFISISLIILGIGLGVIIYIFIPIIEELHSKPSILLVGLMCASIFAHLFKDKILNKLEIE